MSGPLPTERPERPERPERLARSAAGRPAAPVRIVHLGLGAFHRAHQAWYTARADDAGAWGIAAFTGRTPDAARMLAGQDGLYTLTVRGERDDVEVVDSIVEAVDGARVDRLVELLAAPTTAVVTLTITEAGYRLDAAGGLDRDDPVVRADLERLRTRLAGPADALGDPADAPVAALARLLLGLQARRLADAGPIAVVPCDNLPANGAAVRDALDALARASVPDLADWLATQVSCVSTSVDRITPRVDGEVAAVAAAGWVDDAPVVTEPFTDWVLAGGFPAGRPAWESAGATFVDDVEPYERRKLWLLNGAHSILANAGLARGLRTVAQARADDACWALVEAFWAEAAAHLPDGIEHVAYRAALAERFANARIEHLLSQVATDSATKLRVRVAAVARAERAAGRPATACADALAAWVRLVLAGDPPADSRSDEVATAAAAPDPAAALLAVVDPWLAEQPEILARVREPAAPSTTPAPEEHP